MDGEGCTSSSASSVSDARAAGRVSTVIDNDFYDDLGVDGWWDENGPQYGLHQLNPLRVQYFRKQLEREGVCAQCCQCHRCCC